jgi:hypothetical protein
MFSRLPASSAISFGREDQGNEASAGVRIIDEDKRGIHAGCIRYFGAATSAAARGI